MDPRVIELLSQVKGEFKPYSYFCEDSDTLTVYFRDDPDYSKRLTDHVTIYLSLETEEIIGCRIKGISGIIESLPNFVHVNHRDFELSLVFLPFMGEASESVRESIRTLGRSAMKHRLTLSRTREEDCPA